METIIREGLAQMGLEAPQDAAAKLAEYGRLLLEQNQVMNLTAIKEPDQVARLHFLDSAALVPCLEGAGAADGASLVDVGTGAGFPGVVLALLRPQWRVTLVDSLGKRLDWLSTVCARLGLANVVSVHARAEEQALVPGFRDAFDFATARAVADLRVLTELCLPYVKVGGRFLAMKAAGCEAEVSAAAHAVDALGGKLLSGSEYHIPGTDVDRKIVPVEKTAPTPKGYPRRWAKIQKAPL